MSDLEIERRGLRDAQEYLYDMRRFNWNEFGINYATGLVCRCLDAVWEAQQRDQVAYCRERADATRKRWADHAAALKRS